MDTAKEQQVGAGLTGLGDEVGHVGAASGTGRRVASEGNDAEFAAQLEVGAQVSCEFPELLAMERTLVAFFARGVQVVEFQDGNRHGSRLQGAAGRCQSGKP